MVRGVELKGSTVLTLYTLQVAIGMGTWVKAAIDVVLQQPGGQDHWQAVLGTGESLSLARHSKVLGTGSLARHS